ncbi:MAG: energy transducer TonB [Eudoraea sp.]|nr:energy transducer TonB [Eudoraea sp.]
MIKYILLIILCISPSFGLSQDHYPLETIEKAPAFKSCKGQSGDELRACFYREFSSYVQQNLVYPPEVNLKNINSRVYTSFMIDQKGKVVNVMASGEHPSLEEEAIRLITELPKMSPGLQNGEKVTTSVNIPIQFGLPPKSNDLRKPLQRPAQFNDSIAATLDRVPIFPGCENLSNEDSRSCFNKKMQEHIRDNFRYPRMAQLKNIQGTVYANFMINIDGSISDISLIAPHQLLADETLRIIKLLPIITPAMQEGRNVRAPFSFPISFKLLN